MTEVKAAQYESEKSFRTKLQDMAKKSTETIESLQVNSNQMSTVAIISLLIRNYSVRVSCILLALKTLMKEMVMKRHLCKIEKPRFLLFF